MKRIVFVLLVFVFVPLPSNSQQIPPIEPLADIDDFEEKEGIIGDMVRIVRSNGWSCDSITAAKRKPVFLDPSKFGFILVCNNYRYLYEIRNRGGIWVGCMDKCDF